MKSRIFAKLLLSFLLVIGTATLILDFVIRQAWEQSLKAEISGELTQKTQLLANRVQSDHSRPLAKLVAEEASAANARATVIEASGKVLADSQADPESMENHATRPEFKAALAGHIGSDLRRSHTVGIEFLYVAAPIPGGAVRLAYPLSTIAATTAQVRRQILYASAISILPALLLAALLARGVTRRLTRIVAFAERIAAGDLTARMQEAGDDEIGQVAAALDRTANRLEESFNAVQRSRDQMETLLNGIQDAVFAVSAEERVIWSNGALARLPLKARHGQGVLDTVRDPSVVAAVKEALATRTVQRARATSVVPGRLFDVTAAPMPDGGVVCVLHDLTELERVEKTRRDFIANVSHELRTPLTSIRGYAETLLEEPGLAKGTQEFLEVIRKNAQRMARLTEDLLALARVESGEEKMQFEAVPASVLIEEAAKTFAEMAGGGLKLKVASTSEGTVLADREAVQQVFRNLIENACRYGASGGRLEMGAAERGERVEFYVRDFGPGIPSEHLGRLFERFYRVDKARSAESGGTGLGLSIVKHIVLNHHGEVRVESELHAGSTFYFSLPMAERLSAAGARSERD